jgi:probable F420-dependent oxidoreductase
MVSHPYDPALVAGSAIARIARAAEDAGFHGIGFTDHPAPSDRWLKAGGHDALDPFVAMTWAAAATRTMRLIPNVVVLPYRNPFIVAKAGATLDLLSEGRFTLSVGSGYLKSEFAALGVDHAARNEIFDESVDVIRAIWSGDDVSFAGEHFSARGITAHPRPASPPPIWIGGNSARARRRVAERGDGWAPFPAPAELAKTSRTAGLGTVDELAVALVDLRVQLAANGRSLDDVDVSFANHAGGSPTSDRFDADAHIEGIRALEALGVTWIQVGMSGDDVGRTVDEFARYGELVISRV